MLNNKEDALCFPYLSYLKKRNCVSTSLTQSYASCIQQDSEDTQHIHT